MPIRPLIRLGVVVLAAAAVAWPRDVSGQQPLAAVECRPRDGLPHFLAKARAGGDLRVAYLGGSITAAPGWRVSSLDWLRKEFPAARFAEINAAIGGTGSDLGAFRVSHDVIAHRPDLVFIEFAVNDGGGQPERIQATMEGIVRQIRRADPATDICFVYTLSEPMLPELARGECPRAAAAMEAVADHYRIPSVHFGVEVARRIAAGTLVFKADRPKQLDPAAVPMLFSSDGVHPHIETGHRLYQQVLERSFASLVAATRPAVARGLPDPLRSDNWEKAKMIPIERSMLRGEWRQVAPADDERAKAFAARMPVLWKATAPGAELSFAFTGTLLSVYDLLGPGGGVVSVSIDGGPSRSVPRIDGYCTYWRIAQLPIPVQPAASHRATFRLEATVPDKAAILFEKNRPDIEKDPGKYADNTWYAAAILLLGDPAPAAGDQPR